MIADPHRCPICGQYTWRDVLHNRPHICPPGWHVWISDPAWDHDREDGYTIYASNAENAAVKFAEQYDGRGDYIFMNDEIQVSVERLAHPEEVHTWLVKGEMVPEYFARKLEVA